MREMAVNSCIIEWDSKIDRSKVRSDERGKVTANSCIMRWDGIQMREKI